MAVDLKKTDVVIVGLGAVGGVAALPLAQAGLEVIGLQTSCETITAPGRKRCRRRTRRFRPIGRALRHRTLPDRPFIR